MDLDLSLMLPFLIPVFRIPFPLPLPLIPVEYDVVPSGYTTRHFIGFPLLVFTVWAVASFCLSMSRQVLLLCPS